MGGNNVWRLLRARPDAVPAARRSIGELPLSAGTREVTELLVSELVTNAIRHGQPEHDGCVLLEARVTGDHGHVEVCDDGGGGEPVVRPLDHSEPGGHGLRIVDQLAADWGTRRDGMRCVWFQVAEKLAA